MTDERRLVTVLFADVVGSTALGEDLDPEDLRQLLSRFYDIAKRVVDSHGGTLEKFIGDAAMAIFGLPSAHDDDARRAVAAAIELRDGVRDEPGLGDRLPIRVGINTGEVVASRDPSRGDFIVTGDAVNVAARLQQSAGAWQILASGRTASAAAGGFAFGPSQELTVKGKSAGLVARAVVGGASAPRVHTPLVGRDADLAQLELVARRAFAERRPYLVSIMAPAGTGKSRLVEEFQAHLEQLAPEARVAVAQCLPYGQRLTYWPLRALLLGLIDDLDPAAGPDEIRRSVREWLARLGAPEPAETAEVLAATIGASDTDVLDRSALFAAWRTALELAALKRPLVLLIEDLHWSSDSLLDLIEFLLQPRGDSPMLMLALTRPELLERRPTWGGGRRNHVSLALEPLDDLSIEQLVQGIIDVPAPDLVTIVAQRADGNPFYAGEIVRSLFERGVDLTDERALAAAAADLPDTVQATVLARLDTLDPVARRVAQLGAVLGRSFSEPGIAAIEPELADEVSAAVEALAERDMVRLSGRGEVTFRHILIREVAYGTLPRAQRRRYHSAAGHWLESEAADRGDPAVELIAFHYREAAGLAAAAGDLEPDLRSRAVAWLQRASEVAAVARGMPEAAAHLQAAIELALPADQPELYESLGLVYGAGDPAAQAFADALRTGTEQGRPPDFLLDSLAHQLMVICRWFASVARQPQVDQVEAMFDQGRRWLPEAGKRSTARFRVALGFWPFWLRNSGVRLPTEQDQSDAQASITAGLALAQELDDPELISAALDGVTAYEQVMSPYRAREMSLQRLAIGARLPSQERADALQMVAWTSAITGDLDQAIEATQVVGAAAQPEQGFAISGASWAAYAHALVGRWDEVVVSVERLRHEWIEADRPAASFALQGLLSGIDWARNREAEDLLNRWREVAHDIVARFDADHPVAALGAILTLDMDGVADIVANSGRYPDRSHYTEHALALCADRGQLVAAEALETVIADASATRKRVLHAQALRVRGVMNGAESDLRASLDLFESIGAGRYGARVRLELGRLTGDDLLVREALQRLTELGELDRLLTGRRQPEWLHITESGLRAGSG